MPTQSNVFQPLPIDTIRAAEAISGKSIYRTIGDQIEQLLADIELAHLDPSGLQSVSTLTTLALVTVFQFSEDLPDRRAAEAARKRPDWKYALHLSSNQPGINSSMLCEFRQALLRDMAAQQAFQQVIDCLAEADLLSGPDGRRAEADEVLAIVCRLSRLEQLIEAMRMILEAVAALEPEWLRAITLPHWYERYSQMQTARALPKTREEQVSLAHAIGADAKYLLDAIATADGQLTSLPEARALRQIWLQQFEQSAPQLQWRTAGCAACAEVNPSSAGLAHH